ncbi:Ubiquinone biosynthesis monooxygenase UbiH/COQ6, 2-octaprenyl-6-methoxyphenol hydroxylase [Candidatus Sodalis pierantonius str. SOPE]|uniref:Ubiquinone biosynthesis monooxygenase UbiH/COQ6, 2-octaprenyl-6-methoxyphenol hydroxylase n=1 Tax=Candidatus Sodalis pierantonii str. SOPE TaxID=2342 RepID=W0HS13_9GAMM|nr:2-octaprenyl-6-methoxyphenyl hydroxylase [Candidatus Sodalis pierantonius]AHF74985.1 Ubiquinone biosynthesis monooxygenase UbiH/COQ6, 2-octaprenyl-6-methoxyphenol hydroxylase [Candidatus Sodalis pierantonius str. SOPE]
MSVTIIGGGMAGATLALALSHLSRGTLQIDLVEARTPESRDHPGFDARAIALAQGTCRELTTIGVWSALASCATAITRVEVSDKGHLGKVQIATDDYQLPALGYVVELHAAGKRLFDLLRQAPGVRLHCPATLTRLRREREETIITLDNGVELNAQLVVAADGSRSPLAAQCGMRWRQRDYQQIAVIANISTAVPHGGDAFERFTPQGPLALLPMSGARNSLVWCLPAAHEQDIADWDEGRFCHALQQAFGWRLGRITAAGERQCYPLRLRTAERHIGHRLALVGNAAQTLHPIAGQGFNLGLRDVMTLAETLAQAAAQGEDIGDYVVLSRYQRRRQPDQAGTVGITDGLIHLFANRHLSLVVGRNLGLLAMAHIPSLRDALALKTLGWVAR